MPAVSVNERKLWNKTSLRMCSKKALLKLWSAASPCITLGRNRWTTEAKRKKPAGRIKIWPSTKQATQDRRIKNDFFRLSELPSDPSNPLSKLTVGYLDRYWFNWIGYLTLLILSSLDCFWFDWIGYLTLVRVICFNRIGLLLLWIAFEFLIIIISTIPY